MWFFYNNIAILLFYAKGTFPVQSTVGSPGEEVSSYVVGAGNMPNAEIQPDSGMHVCMYVLVLILGIP